MRGEGGSAVLTLGAIMGREDSSDRPIALSGRGMAVVDGRKLYSTRKDPGDSVVRAAGAGRLGETEDA